MNSCGSYYNAIQKNPGLVDGNEHNKALIRIAELEKENGDLKSRIEVLKEQITALNGNDFV